MTFIQYDNKWQQQRVHFSNLVISYLRKTSVGFYYGVGLDEKIDIIPTSSEWMVTLSVGDWIILNDQGKFWRDLSYLESHRYLHKKVQG